MSASMMPGLFMPLKRHANNQLHRGMKMKGRILLVVVSLLIPLCAFGQTVTLSWDASPTPGVTGYKVYYDTDTQLPMDSTAATEGSSPIDVGNVLTTTVTVPDGTWWFAVTAYDAAGYESSFSNFVSSATSGKLHIGGAGKIMVGGQGKIYMRQP